MMTRTNRSERLHYSNNVNSRASEAGEGESRTVGTATSTFRENFLIFDFFLSGRGDMRSTVLYGRSSELSDRIAGGFCGDMQSDAERFSLESLRNELISSSMHLA
jgi:hypothetical protein